MSMNMQTMRGVARGNRSAMAAAGRRAGLRARLAGRINAAAVLEGKSSL
jgi:hypothetical protein